MVTDGRTDGRTRRANTMITTDRVDQLNQKGFFLFFNAFPPSLNHFACGSVFVWDTKISQLLQYLSAELRKN